ncbi:MAG: sulfotransferase [Methylococcales bacterium]
MFTFLGVGAQKAGTTWLFRQMEQHPSLGFPLGKEAHFWNMLHDRDRIDRYLERFSRDDRKEGEITPAYAILPQAVIRTIAQCQPDLRLIYIIRNPIERAWSSALMAMRRAELEIHEASDQWFVDHFQSAGSLARGDYERCLRNWRAIFPSRQLLVLRYEHIGTAPERLLNDCFRHLGVDAVDPETLRLRGCRRRIFTGPRHPLRPAVMPLLSAIYRPRIHALAAYLGEDLSDWLATSNSGWTGDANDV